MLHTAHQGGAWWRSAVIYQIYPRSFADANGDGIGDLAGITTRLPYLRALGVDAIWLSPFYTSPQADAGYDVADYRDIDPLFGSLADADLLIKSAHDLALKVIVDLVPNHSSDEHPWFQTALASAPGSPERDRYMFRDGSGPGGGEPPNNWQSVFGGPAWSRAAEPGTPGQWYLHLFDAKQPDFNWQNADVRHEFEDVLRFWLDRGVDGFRVDVAHGLVKAPGLPDWSGPMNMLDLVDKDLDRPPMWDQDPVHEIYRSWRKILDSYNPPSAVDHDAAQDRVMCAEAWVDPPERAALYVRDGEFHQAFNFDFLQSDWTARSLHRNITRSLEANDGVGAPTTWVLSNHDVVRHASRLGLPIGTPRPNGIGVGDPQPDPVLGLRRARAATTLMLALPGGAYLYQGEELGLPEHTTMPDAARQDPTWERTRHAERGRDGARVPIPWEEAAPTYGFGPTGRSWLPQPEVYGELAVDQQDGREGSTLELYRLLLRTRAEHHLGEGSLIWLDAGQDVVSFENATVQGRVRVLLNLGGAPLPLPDDAVLLAASGPVDEGVVPVDTTVWFTAGGHQ
nr:glycoside hydrolase family 13 protein [Leekyejoonella antrihumi]